MRNPPKISPPTIVQVPLSLKKNPILEIQPSKILTKYPPPNNTASQLHLTATNITPSTLVSRIRIQYRMTNGVNNKSSNENRHYNGKINTGMLNVTDNWQLPMKKLNVPMVKMLQDP